MPNQGKTRKSASTIIRHQHVLVTANVRVDGSSEVTEVVIVGLGKWRRPLARAFDTLDAALEAGMAFALTRFEGPGAGAHDGGGEPGMPGR